MDWEFNLPVKIIFGSGSASELPRLLEEIGGKGILVASGSLVRNGTAGEIEKLCGGKISATFSDVRPNPTLQNVDDCAALIRQQGASFTVALGGGSVMDCCKAASAIAGGDGTISEYFNGGRAFKQEEALPMIALPTTSGTASEVTNISVLSDTENNIKSPINDPVMYARAAIVDPKLTLSVPPQVTASTGLDVLSHAVESFWSTLSQPICSACSLHAAKTVFQWLDKAYQEPGNLEAREKMAEASIVAGVAFSHPRTTVSHACSFPLTNTYHVPHGEACAMTLDYCIRYNAARWESPRLDEFAAECGFASPNVMADEIYNMKKRMGMRTTLSEIGCTTDEEIRELARGSMSMLVTRNPVVMTEDDIYNMYKEIK